MQCSALSRPGRMVRLPCGISNLPKRAACVKPLRVVPQQTQGGDAAPIAPKPTNPNLPPDTTTRQYRRTVYDFAYWAKHRQVNRYLYNLWTMPGSRIIRTLMQPTSFLLAVATLVGLYEQGIETHVLPDFLPKMTLATAEPATLTSFALSLLLVFRTNSSYGRFDEARKIWGGILNRARAIGNQAVTFIPKEDVAGREAIAKWTVGFCRALQAHLQEDANLRNELEKATPKWTKEEIDIIVAAQHKPIKAISVLSELTRQLKVDAFQALQMQENVTFFYDALGGCERLLRTPIPLSYTRHTARFLTLWLMLLPLALWERFHWLMLPIQFSIALLLLGIDEIGVQIEEPFGILPLDAICTRAQTDVVSLIKDDSDVKGYVSGYKDVNGTPLAGKADTIDTMLLAIGNGASASSAAAFAEVIEPVAAVAAVASTSAAATNGAAKSSGKLSTVAASGKPLGLGPPAAGNVVVDSGSGQRVFAPSGWRQVAEEPSTIPAGGLGRAQGRTGNPSFDNVFGEESDINYSDVNSILSKLL